MFIDKVRADFRSGTGGNGAIAFGIDKKPSGGDGGKGGDIWLIGDAQRFDLRSFVKQDVFEAGKGEPGGSERKQGKNSKDLEIRVPLVTEVTDLAGNVLAEVTEDGQRVLLATGGQGGLGNYNFRSGQRLTLRKATPGKAGTRLQTYITLKLITDVVMIGFPNAGKSSLINALSNAKAKVGAYPFTTLEPSAAVADGMIILDFPGLIEGSAKGKGLGRKFTRHIGSSKAILHCISLEESDPARAYTAMRNELEEIDPALPGKPELIALTKSDEFDADYIADFKRRLGVQPAVTVSVLDDTSLRELTSRLKELLQ
ncbi:MAG: GTPase Obg/CgtA [candidate division WS6 bacterium OLB20]|uniref:GTPase Obg/CgtA n=1 Tax=candidate division WS6 bacterium OLB20 TaxID=1617426 RepID=A0A136LXV3_9BACT|nr:MAG: GTPase Obg/CgtA [candidate division WS6 bacterium OLB20]